MTHFYSPVVVFFLCVTSSYAIKVVDVDTICKNATNPSFCSHLLNSKPGASRDLLSLAQYTIDVVRANVTNTIILINSLLAQSASDYVAKYHYAVCLAHFSEDLGALGVIEECQAILKMGAYQSLVQCATDIERQANECISGESPSDPPYHDTSVLPKYVDVVDQVAQIFASVSTYLTQA